MLESKALATASAVVALAYYLLCVVLVLAAPDLLFNFFALTTHGVDISSLRPTGTSLNLVNVLLGAVIFTAFTWVTLYCTAEVYNRLRSKK